MFLTNHLLVHVETKGQHGGKCTKVRGQDTVKRNNLFICIVYNFIPSDSDRFQIPSEDCVILIFLKLFIASEIHLSPDLNAWSTKKHT